MTTKSNDSASRFTAREYAALHMKVPQSGNDWLDELIQAARDMDVEQFQAKLNESTHGSYEQATGRIERPEKETAKATKPVSKKRKDEVTKELNPNGNWD